LFGESYSIVVTWRKGFSQLWNVQGVNEVKHTEINKAQPLVPEPSALDFELASENLKRHKSSGTDHIQTELINEGV
jgi:hypothetical protein